MDLRRDSMLGMEPINVQVFSYKDLARYADNFSESNCIGHFQFGKIYRAMINYSRGPRYMMVKTWKDQEIYNCGPKDNQIRLMKEVVLLRHEMLISHPGMLKLYGYSRDGEHLCVAFEFKPFDSLFNLIPKDGFTWLQRVKSALGLASLLKFLHGVMRSPDKPFIVHNLDAAHIVLDEDYNPKLCDFGLMSGGIFPEKEVFPGHDIMGCYGYINMDSCNTGSSTKNDVFGFGVILLSLISKRVYSEENKVAGEPYVYEWALREAEAFESDESLKNTEFTLVHENLAAESDFYPSDGQKITKLALDCINGVECQRPTMKQVYRVLLKLEVVKQHAEFLGVNKN